MQPISGKLLASRFRLPSSLSIPFKYSCPFPSLALHSKPYQQRQQKTTPQLPNIIKPSIMSSLSFHLLPTATATATPPFSSSNPSSSSLLFNPGVWFNGAKDKRLNFDFRIRCSAVSNARSQEYSEVLRKQNGLPVLKWHEIVEDDTQEEALKVSLWKEINKRVETIKKMLSSMEDGEISVSAYDTAWVALVEDLNGSGAPQFPSALQWIIDNQLADGSWGDNEIFEAHDRILNTLGCVIALKSWNVHPEKCEQGLAFFKNNLHKLEDEDPEHMPIGFEVAFPSLLEIARKLDIEIPDAPILKEIYDRRNLKLSRIPKDILHKVPTTLLHSLEGMQNLDWNKLIKLQCEDGSFLFSPASTAYALQQTKDQKCLNYLNNAVQKHKGGVPNVYPVDLFENIWAIDRLNRLGISRYFEPEIKECVKHIHKYWRPDGICWARNSEVHDIDDTAMGFRILRLHGYDVSPDVFKFFEKNGEFCCFAGQSSQAVTGMFNLYRASQVLYPGEKIMEDARKYSSKFLREKRIRNELQDKWIITKDLTGEVEFALDVPWYAILPRVETRSYLEQYGGEDDVWIGKTLYRMPFVNNNEYLELGKLDYNTCQAIQRAEWDKFQKWYDECSLGSLGISKRSLLFSYFLAAASIFEQERSKERLAWAKTRILLEAVHSCFNEDNSSRELRSAFVHDFKKATSTTTSSGFNGNGRILDAKKKRQELLQLLLETLNGLSVDALVSHGRDISHDLRHAWENWLSNWETEGDRHRGEARLLVQTINLTAGRWVSEESHSDYPVYQKLADLTDRICHQLGHYQQHKVSGNGSQNTSSDSVTTPEIESNMQELVKLVYQNSSSDVKETFLTVAKSFYYTAFCDPGTINYHIARVLFERVY